MIFRSSRTGRNRPDQQTRPLPLSGQDGPSCWRQQMAAWLWGHLRGWTIAALWTLESPL